MKNIDAVIFDLDGTLLDSAPDIHFALNRLLEENHLPSIDIKTTASFIGNGVRKLVERAMNFLGQEDPDLDLLSARFITIYNQDPASLTIVFEGVRECLRSLQDHDIQMAICTNKPYASAKMLLEKKGLLPFFDVVVGGDTLAVMKPDPAPLLHTIVLLNAPISKVIYIGDSMVDVLTAKRASVRFGLYKEGYLNANEEDIDADFEFSTFMELLGCLR